MTQEAYGNTCAGSSTHRALVYLHLCTCVHKCTRALVYWHLCTGTCGHLCTCVLNCKLIKCEGTCAALTLYKLAIEDG